jgi:hypothetical protein
MKHLRGTSVLIVSIAASGPQRENLARVRSGCTRRQLLFEQRGQNTTILQWLDELTADCPRKRAASVSDQCHARCPDLPKVL